MLSALVPRGQVEGLRELAREHDRSVSAEIRQALREHLVAQEASPSSARPRARRCHLLVALGGTFGRRRMTAAFSATTFMPTQGPPARSDSRAHARLSVGLGTAAPLCE